MALALHSRLCAEREGKSEMRPRRRLLGSGALALALSASVPFLPNMALAQPRQVLLDGAESAAMHNAAYDRGLAESYTSPETIGEMLQCSALWQRWSGILGSSQDSAFVSNLREDLSAARAEIRHRYWQRQARRDMREESDLSYFDKMHARAESWADSQAAGYATGADSEISSMMGWLATC